MPLKSSSMSSLYLFVLTQMCFHHRLLLSTVRQRPCGSERNNIKNSKLSNVPWRPDSSASVSFLWNCNCNTVNVTTFRTVRGLSGWWWWHMVMQALPAWYRLQSVTETSQEVLSWKEKLTVWRVIALPPPSGTKTQSNMKWSSGKGFFFCSCAKFLEM